MRWPKSVAPCWIATTLADTLSGNTSMTTVLPKPLSPTWAKAAGPIAQQGNRSHYRENPFSLLGFPHCFPLSKAALKALHCQPQKIFCNPKTTILVYREFQVNRSRLSQSEQYNCSESTRLLEGGGCLGAMFARKKERELESPDRPRRASACGLRPAQSLRIGMAPGTVQRIPLVDLRLEVVVVLVGEVVPGPHGAWTLMRSPGGLLVGDFAP